MRTIVKVDIQTYPITYKMEVHICESESIAIRKLLGYGSEHRNVISEHGTGTGTRIGTGTRTGTKL